MKLKIYDHSELKIKNKIRDESFKKFCDENKDNEKIDHLDVKRNSKGEIILWEIHHKKI